MPRQRLEVEVVGNVTGFTAAMNRVLSSTTRVGQGFRRHGQDANYFSNQLKAIGTTARYYLAGQFVFGITGAINKLADFKSELGTINSLAGTIDAQGNFRGISGQLGQVGEDAILLSNKLGIAVGDIEQYMQRFFSSFDPPGGTQARLREMNQFVNAVSNLQVSLGTEAGDPQALAGGIASLINAIPGARRNPGREAGKLASAFAYLTAKTPALSGQDIANAAGRFASAFTIANMTPEQMLGTFGVAAQAGGSPSVIIRGIAQLLGTSLLHPNSPTQKAAFLRARLPTDATSLRNLGGMNVLSKLMQSVTTGNVHISNRAALRSITDPTQALSQAGVSGINLTQLYAMFGRQESVRQFVNIIAQGGVPAIQKFTKGLQQAEKVNLNAQRARAANSQRLLTRMTQARSNLGLSLVGGADWPLEHLVADPIIGASNFAARHRTTMQVGVGGALSLGAAAGLRRLGAFRRFGRLGRFIGAASSIERDAIGAAISKEELPAAISGGATDGSRGNPFWVVISPLSWTVGSPGGLASSIPGAPGSGGGKSFWNKVNKLLPLGAAGAVRTGALRTAGGLGALATGTALFENRTHFMENIVTGKDAVRLAHALGGDGRNSIDWQHAGKQPIDWTRTQSPLEIRGEATLDANVKLRDEHGNIWGVVKEAVPVRLWNAHQYPSSKGKPGSRKGSGK